MDSADHKSRLMSASYSSENPQNDGDSPFLQNNLPRTRRSLYISPKDADKLLENSDISPDKNLAKNRRLVIEELIATERTYVSELQSVLDGYLKRIEASDIVRTPQQQQQQTIAHPVPTELQNMSHILFGNLTEIHEFHSRSEHEISKLIYPRFEIFWFL